MASQERWDQPCLLEEQAIIVSNVVESRTGYNQYYKDDDDGKKKKKEKENRRWP